MFVSTTQIPMNSASINFTGACFTLGKGGRTFGKGSKNLSILMKKKKKHKNKKTKLSTKALGTSVDMETHKKKCNYSQCMMDLTGKYVSRLKKH